MHQNLLKYKNYRYLKLTILLLISSVVLYLTHNEAQPPNGGTFQGYILGIISTFFILLLTYLGIRKRKYSSSIGTVEGWTSAHIYLGTSLLLIASLHAAFQIGWNIHTLAYFLMIAVVLSGFYGLFSYMHYPRVYSNNNTGGSQDEWLQEIAENDEIIKEKAGLCRGNIRLFILSALEHTSMSGKFHSQLRGKDSSTVKMQADSKKLISNKNQETVINVLSSAVSNSLNKEEAIALNSLLSLFSRRQRLLKIVRRNLQIKTYLKVWLLFHIPLTIALLAALIVHILVVFIYW